MSAILQYMLNHDGPLTVERFIELNWFGEKTLADLEGEELIEVEEFRDAVQKLVVPHIASWHRVNPLPRIPPR